MAIPSWHKRIQRARELAERYPFSAELLTFYGKVAEFQERMYGDIALARPSLPLPGKPLNALETPNVLTAFESFLDLLERVSPQTLREQAHEMRMHGREEWGKLLDDCWAQPSGAGNGDAAQVLLGKAFLQPYAEHIRATAVVPPAATTLFLCPVCSRKAVCGVLRQRGDGGQRSLLCSLCSAEWEFRRIVCPGCGEEDDTRLPVYVQEMFEYVRVECCDSCKQYLKTVDLTKNGLAEPLVDEIASAPLDLWARERGYAKLEVNILGM